MAKAVAKIKKAIKIIRNEGLPAFAGKLSRRIVYGIANAIKARSFKNVKPSRHKPMPERRFTEKKAASGMQINDDRAKAARFLSEAKADILRSMKR